MTTAELIKILQDADPEGTKTVGISTDYSGRHENFDVVAEVNSDWIELESI